MTIIMHARPILLSYMFESLILPLISFFFFFFNDRATTEIYTLSLHDALPIYDHEQRPALAHPGASRRLAKMHRASGTLQGDRKSTRLNSSHQIISYAVFCLKKKKKTTSKYEHRHTTRRLTLLLTVLPVALQ